MGVGAPGPGHVEQRWIQGRAVHGVPRCGVRLRGFGTDSRDTGHFPPDRGHGARTWAEAGNAGRATPAERSVISKAIIKGK